MAKRKCFTAYDYARARTYYAGTRNNLVYVRMSIRVPRPTQDRMNFSRFRRLVSRSASSGSVPRYCYTLPLWYRHRGCLVFCSGTRVTEFKVPFRQKRWKNDERVEVSQKGTQDEEFVAIA